MEAVIYSCFALGDYVTMSRSLVVRTKLLGRWEMEGEGDLLIGLGLEDIGSHPVI